MQQSNNRIDTTENIAEIKKIVHEVDLWTNENELSWAMYLPAGDWFLVSVVSSYLANLESPEDLLKASKTTLLDLVKAEYASLSEVWASNEN
jgi:hypothetical protein